MKVAVLGYGPGGLIAAKTLVDLGFDVDVIGAGGKSVIGGAQYLHAPILNAEHVTEPEGHIDYVKIGERDNYATKVYGSVNFDVSWDRYQGCFPAWALGPVYDVLWAAFEDKLIHDRLSFVGLSALMSSERYGLVFSSIPLHALCRGNHDFGRVDIALVKHSPIRVDNVVLYNGRQGDPWYRASCIFGEAWTEFGSTEMGAASYIETIDVEDELLEVHRGFKPLNTNCDCHPEVIRIGRFGRWDRRVLLHHVPDQVKDALEEKDLI